MGKLLWISERHANALYTHLWTRMCGDELARIGLDRKTGAYCWSLGPYSGWSSSLAKAKAEVRYAAKKLKWIAYGQRDG